MTYQNQTRFIETLNSVQLTPSDIEIVQLDYIDVIKHIMIFLTLEY